jgi:hypothetical protein
MGVQTTYTKRMKKGTPGLILWDFGTADLTSAIAEGVIPFGYAVVQGSKARTAIVGNVKVIGFATRSLMSIYSINNFVDAFGPQETVPVMREGYVWCVNEGGAAVGDGTQVYADATGKVVNSAAAGALAVPGCRFEIGGAVGALVLVRVDIITV